MTLESMTPLAERELGADSRFSPAALWRAVRKNWPMTVAIASAVTLGMMFYTLGQTKIYEARATIQFDPQPPRPLGNQVQAVVDTGNAYWNNKEYYKTQYWVIQSPRILSMVVRDLNLHKDHRFVENLSPGSAPRAGEVSVDEATQILAKRLTVEPVKESRLATVTYQDADPARAQRVLGLVVDTYVQSNLDEVLQSTTSAADWLRGQVGSLKKELESSELALHNYKKEKNILSVSMDDQSNMLREEITQLNRALTDARTRREQIGARNAELLKISADDPADLPARELISSPLLQELRQEYQASLRERQALIENGKAENHPDVKALSGKADATRLALLSEVRNIQNAVSSELAAASREVDGLAKLTEAAKQRALELNLLEIEYNRLRRFKENNEKLFSLVTERSKESDLTRMLRFNNIKVADRPTLPKVPVTPNVPLNIAGGALAGLVFGLFAAFGREQLDRTIKTPEDAERQLGQTFLGLLPQVADKSPPANEKGRRRRRIKVPAVLSVPELVVHELPSSGIAEAARAIRTNILFMAPDRPYRTLLVTSAGPAEGKTTVACCIAVAMAQAGKRIVLLDCDMRRPRIHRVFQASNAVGITTALIDASSVDDILVDTAVPNLRIAPTGPIPPNPAELLHSEAFERLLNELQQRCDCVVIDSPPVVPVTDAAVLSTKVDGTVLVVRAFKTSRDLARRAVRSLRDVGGHAVGTVLNAVDLERREYGYYQYYYYKREGYASDTDPPPPSAPSERSSEHPQTVA